MVELTVLFIDQRDLTRLRMTVVFGSVRLTESDFDLFITMD